MKTPCIPWPTLAAALGAWLSCRTAQAGLDDGLIAHWTFDDPANLGMDSASTNHGTANEGVFWFANSRVGAGALLTTGNGHLAVPDQSAFQFTATNSYTVSAWFMAQPNTSWGGIVTKGRAEAPWYGIWRDPDGPRIFSGSAETWPPIEPVLPDGDWHHAAIVQDGTAQTYALYVDGVDQWVPYVIPDTTGAGDLWIGGADNGEYFHGLIDEVRVYNRPLSADEIGLLFSAATPTQAPTPLAILIQPLDNSVFPNDSVTLSAQASQASLAFQWYKDGIPYGDAGQAMAGAATPISLSGLSLADNGATYYVVFSDSTGRSISSRVATVNVQAATGIDAGLVAHWTFDDPANLGKDSASTNHGIATGGVYAFGTGRVGAGALAVDGSDGYLEVADNPSLRFTAGQTFTLAAWVYPASLPSAWKGIVTKSRNQSPWYGIWLSSENQWTFGGPQNLTGSDLPLDDSGNLVFQWHHVVIMQDGSQATSAIYVDGVLAATGASADVNGSGPLCLGGAASVSEFFDGLIDDVRLYRRGLTEEELLQLDNAPASTTNLPLQILTQPKDVRTIPGQPVAFTVAANQFSLTCQWRKGATPMGAPVAAVLGQGGVSASFTIDSATLADHDTTYQAVLTGPGGSVTSLVARLTVKEPIDGLLAHYAFDDAANLGADTALGLNPGTPSGGASFSQASRVGSGALQVDGVDGHIAVAEAPYLRFADTSSYTVSVWFQARSNAAWGGIVTQGRTEAPWYGIWRDPDGPRIFSGSAETWPPVEPILLDGDWHHAAIVQDGSVQTYALYVDGVDQQVPFTLPATTGGGDLWIGGADNGEYFKGLIDEVRIYNRALSPAEIMTLVNVASPPAISVNRGSNGITITYTGTLQASASLNGTWTNVVEAMSPLAIPTPQGMGFYRTKQ
jgi:hypothetical protein